jgi:hypothetical protein
MPFLYPKPEDAPRRFDRDPLITLIWTKVLNLAFIIIIIIIIIIIYHLYVGRLKLYT